MEEIDIENLNFDEYNREVYQENNKKEERSHFFNIQKNYKKMIDKYVENYYKNRKDENEIKDENLERIKKRKY